MAKKYSLAPTKKVLVGPHLQRLGTLRELTKAKLGTPGDSGGKDGSRS